MLLQAHGFNGRIKRDPADRKSFQASHPCPAKGRATGACPGLRGGSYRSVDTRRRW